MDTGSHLLEVRDLRTQFFTQDGVVRPSTACRSMSIAARRSGWSASPAAARASPPCRSCGLIPHPPGKIVGGEVCSTAATC